MRKKSNSVKHVVVMLVIMLVFQTSFVSTAAGSGEVYNGLYVTIDIYPEQLVENMTLVQKGDYCYPYQITLFRNGKIEGRVRTTEGTTWVQSDESVVMNEWNKISIYLVEGHLMLILNEQIVAEVFDVQGDLVDRDTYTTILGRMGSNQVSMNGFQVTLFDYDSSEEEVKEPEEPIAEEPVIEAHPMTEEVKALLTDKGWDEDENALLIENAIYRIFKAVTVLSDEEILMRIKNNINNIQYGDSGSTFWGDTVEIGYDSEMESSFVHEMLHAIGAKVTEDDFQHTGLVYLVNQRSYENIDDWLMGDRLNEGFNDYLVSMAYEENISGIINVFPGDYKVYTLSTIWPDGISSFYPNEVGLTMPMIYLVGGTELEEAFFGDYDNYVNFRVRFDDAYGQGMFDYLVKNQGKFINMLYNGGVDPEGVFEGELELIKDYTNVLVSSMHTRFLKDRTDPVALEQFRVDYESFLKYLPIIEGEEYEMLDFIDENLN